MTTHQLRRPGRSSVKEGLTGRGLYTRADLLSVRPQLARLVAILPVELIPDGFRARINKAYLDIVHDQVSFAAEFLKINSLLTAEGIPAVPFKGFWLAHEYYGSLGDREAGDTDLFTEFRHLERIGQIMLENGYTVEPQMAGYTLDDLAGRAGSIISTGRRMAGVFRTWSSTGE